MSDAVSVMGGAVFSGAVTVADAGVRGMIALRGDLGDEKLARAVKAAVGLGLPKTRAVKQGKKGGVAWMSPDELLLLCDYATVGDMVARLDAALAGTHHLALDVSDARAVFTLTGIGVREVIAKGAPVDSSAAGLPVGEIRRSHLGQAAAAFWLTDAQTMTVVCFRSLGQYVWTWLCNAAEKDSLPGL